MKHGLSGYKQHKCRCDVCRAAHIRQLKVERLRALRGQKVLLDAKPTADKIRALWRDGWSSVHIAELLGWNWPDYVAQTAGRKMVRPETEAAIDRAFRELGGRQGPDLRLRNMGVRKGWPNSLDLLYGPQPEREGKRYSVDEAKVLRWIGGDTSITLSRGEKIEVTARLTRRGVTHQEIQKRLAISGTEITKILRELQEAS